MRSRPSTVPLTPGAAAGAAVAPVLEARSVSKHYGGVRAVSGVSLAVPAGEIYAVIGPNGAGKTTFLRLLSGETAPNTGRILLRGEDITGRGVTAVNQAGMAKSYQINQLFNDLTCRQNLRIAALGRHRGTLRFDVFRAADSIAAVEESIEELIDELGLAASADLPVATLAYGEKRRIELGLALGPCRRSYCSTSPSPVFRRASGRMSSGSSGVSPRAARSCWWSMTWMRCSR
jgi:branched-chain amino acid transport system permease protein